MADPGSTRICAAPKWHGERCGRGAKKAVTVQRYHFHCVGRDGDAVFDLAGRWVPRLRALGPQADRVARTLMSGALDTDWSDWLVDVHDARGRRVLVRAFTDARPAR
ncbi:DUF6894 family protein [Methylorubrum extorquens]|uniref:DUF6894 family protein n=1 Tax=Methylorubrum extorquens TaxID=408 RepID=UPI00387ED928